MFFSWENAISRKYKMNNPTGTYFVNFATVYWVDVFVRDSLFLDDY